jgi:hypothetical protein
LAISFGGGAARTPPVEVHPLPSHLEIGLAGYTVSQAQNSILTGIGVDDCLALDADQIDVGLHVRFVPGHLLEGQFLNQAAPLKDAQGRIDGSQGHGREMVPNPFIYLLYRGVVGGIEHRFGYRKTLRRHPDLPLPQSLNELLLG